MTEAVEIAKPVDNDPKVPEIKQDAKASHLTTADNYPAAVKTKAYDLFLNSSFDLTDIALELEVPRHAIALWARRGNWLQRKQELETLAMVSSDAKYVSFRQAEKLPEAKKQLKLSQGLEDLLQKVIDVKMAEDAHTLAGDTIVLKRLAEALAGVTGVSARVVGINDQPVGQEMQNQITGQGRQPLIILGINAEPRVPVMSDDKPRDPHPDAVDADYDMVDESKAAVAP